MLVSGRAVITSNREKKRHGWSSEVMGDPLQIFEDEFQMWPEPFSLGLVISERRTFRCQVRRLRQFHLDGMNAFARTPMMARNPAALESAIEHGRKPRSRRSVCGH